MLNPFGAKKDLRNRILCFGHARNEQEPKNGNGGRGRGRKEMLADKPLDFENLHSPANTVPDWLG